MRQNRRGPHGGKRLDRRLLERGEDLPPVLVRPVRVLHHEHRDELLLGIDAHVGLVGPAVTEGAAGLAIREPTEAIGNREAAGLRRRHLPDRIFREITLSVENAAAEDHAAEQRNVGGGGKQAACRKRHAPATSMQIDKGERGSCLQPGLVGVGLVGLCQSPELGFGGPEGGVVHAQRLKQSLGHELLVRHSTDDFDDASCGVDAGVVVLELGPRLELQGTRRVALHRRAQGRSVPSLPRRGRTDQAAGVRKQVLDSDGVHGAFQRHLAVSLLFRQYLPLELRQILLHGSVDAYFAFVHQHHQRGGGHRLGHRCDPEEAVGAHRLLGRNVGVAHCFQASHLVLRGHQRHRPGQGVAVDKRLDAPGNAGRRSSRASLRPQKAGSAMNRSKKQRDGCNCRKGFLHDRLWQENGRQGVTRRRRRAHYPGGPLQYQ